MTLHAITRKGRVGTFDRNTGLYMDVKNLHNSITPSGADPVRFHHEHG